MKIFYIDPNNTTPQYNYPLVEKLNEEGVQTVFFTSKNEKFVNYYEKIYSIAPNYWFFKFENKIKIKKLRKFVKMFLYPIQNIRLFLKIKKEKPQIIHYNWLAFPFIDFFMINKISRLGIKIILSVHDYKQHDRQKLRVLEKKVFDRVDGIICLSEFVKSQFPKKLQTKIIVIQHGNCYEKELKNLKITTKKSDNFSLLMIGNIKPYKGAEILIDAVNSLSKSNIKLEICGRCNYQQKLVERAKNPNIYFDFGFVEHNKLYRKIAHCDVEVLPYLRATQSGLPYIFAHFKKPLIVTNSGGLSEQVSTDFAEIVEPNAESIAKAILKIQKRKIKPSSFDEFLEQNSWQNTVKKYINLYRKMADE